VSRIAQKVVARKQLRSFYWRSGRIPNVRIPRFGAGAHRYEAHPTSLARVDATMRGAARGDRLSVAVSRAADARLEHRGQSASPLRVGKLVCYDDAAAGWFVGASDLAAIWTVPAPRLTAPATP
jgi:hypothetical protein